MPPNETQAQPTQPLEATASIFASRGKTSGWVGGIAWLDVPVIVACAQLLAHAHAHAAIRQPSTPLCSARVIKPVLLTNCPFSLYLKLVGTTTYA
jgi:hypothetical protein